MPVIVWEFIARDPPPGNIIEITPLAKIPYRLEAKVS